MPQKENSSTPLAKKLGIKEEWTVVIVVFSTNKSDLKKRFESTKKSLDPTGRLWVAYPKKTSTIPTDITFAGAQKIGLAAGLVDNKSAAIDADWSGVQFVYRLKDRPTIKR